MPAFMTAIGTAVGLSGTAATVGGAAITGLAAYGATQMIGGDGMGGMEAPSMPSLQPLPEAPTVEKAEVAAQESIINRRRAISRNRTIFTGPLGITEEEKSGLFLKTLTGE